MISAVLAVVMGLGGGVPPNARKHPQRVVQIVSHNSVSKRQLLHRVKAVYVVNYSVNVEGFAAVSMQGRLPQIPYVSVPSLARIYPRPIVFTRRLAKLGVRVLHGKVSDSPGYSHFSNKAWSRAKVFDNWPTSYSLVASYSPLYFLNTKVSAKPFFICNPINSIGFHNSVCIPFSHRESGLSLFASRNGTTTIAGTLLRANAVGAPGFHQRPHDQQSSSKREESREPSRPYLTVGRVSSRDLSLKIGALMLALFGFAPLSGYCLFRRFNYGHRKRWGHCAALCIGFGLALISVTYLWQG